MVVEGSQGVSRHGIRSWCGVVGGTWQRFPEMASENEQRLLMRGVHDTACLSLHTFHTSKIEQQVRVAWRVHVDGVRTQYVHV